MPNNRIFKDSIQIIINADDYGYFKSVSEGILELIKRGMVTATGIIPNSSCFDEQVAKLQQFDSVDIGVHLNISHGRPLSKVMEDCLIKYKGKFPGKDKIVSSIFSGKIKLNSIESEIRSQIERCLNTGLKIYFLNSHEHIHMLPPIYLMVLRLAKKYKIPFVRYSKAEWFLGLAMNGLVRNLVLQIFNSFNFLWKPKNSLTLIGMSESGKLNINSLKRQFSNLKPSRIYELMCHPGYFDQHEITDPSLIAYHNWMFEFELLKSLEIKDLCRRHGVKITRYSDIV